MRLTESPPKLGVLTSSLLGVYIVRNDHIGLINLRFTMQRVQIQ